MTQSLREQKLVLAKYIENCLALAHRMYKGSVPRIVFRFDQQGVAAGRCTYQRHNGVAVVSFNMHFYTQEENGHECGILGDTIPHEIAHAICFHRRTDLGHGWRWRETARMLGGTGSTRHDGEVVYAKGNTYEYTVTCGTVVRVSTTLHRRIQAGSPRTITKTKGKVDKYCKFELIA
jgi:predicted SprT family Zn-dependent metalloprotease